MERLLVDRWSLHGEDISGRVKTFRKEVGNLLLDEV